MGIIVGHGVAVRRVLGAVGQVIQGVRDLRGQAITVAGLLLLVSTPVLRLAVYILALAHERDRVFTIITSVMLALLLLSFVLGKIEG
jgi:uncharacterized membrane protein